MLAATTLVAMLIYLPNDLVRFANSLLHTIFFASNFYFLQFTGYFGAAQAGSSALLHTWSLAIEEQFYVLFPLLLLLATRLGWRRTWLVAIVALASFACSALIPRSFQNIGFYLPLTRFWELMIGALLALQVVPVVVRPIVRETLAFISLAAVAGTVFLLREGGLFPGWIAAVPVLGAAGLIHFSSGTIIGRLLSLPMLVGIGLISYSLYLWHWPVLVLSRYWLMRPLTLAESAALIALAYVLAALSWRYIEQPFRNRALLSRRTIFALTAAGTACIAGFCLVMTGSGGLPQRVPEEVMRLDAFAKDISPKRDACNDSPRNPVAPEQACALGAAVAPSIAVWGDSHGIELSYALGEFVSTQNKAVLQLSSSGCIPGLDYNPGNRPQCAIRNRTVLDFLIRSPSIDTIIITAQRGSDAIDDMDTIFAGTELAVAELSRAEKVVVLVYPTPQSPEPVPQILAREQWSRGQFDAELEPLGRFLGDLTNTLDRLDALVAAYGAKPIRPTDIFCPDAACLAYLDGQVLYYDTHHPTVSGARLLAPLFAEVVARSGGR